MQGALRLLVGATNLRSWLGQRRSHHGDGMLGWFLHPPSHTKLICRRQAGLPTPTAAFPGRSTQDAEQELGIRYFLGLRPAPRADVDLARRFCRGERHLRSLAAHWRLLNARPDQLPTFATYFWTTSLVERNGGPACSSRAADVGYVFHASLRTTCALRPVLVLLSVSFILRCTARV